MTSPASRVPCLASALLAVALSGAPLRAQELSPGSASVFRQFGSRVVKIEISENGSAAKASLGSGFYVSAEGDVITNYHVMSQVVHDPDRYDARIITAAGDTLGVTLLAIDVVHDLALVRSSAPPAAWFTLHEVSLEQGDRLFSLGHPKDLGLSIVEGTYNGLLRHTLYPKIHFTGSLNPGMSGGPTLSASGDVAGINVSTEGNQVSFLVPASEALALFERSRKPGFAPVDDFLAEAGRQILAYQDEYLDLVFRKPIPTVRIGRFTLPTEPASFFKCWADADRSPDQPYETVSHQ
ncbi:MAG TPA: serine protease, partial [Gemmatimonadales bacterium]|nr:serine protease [Gemmatimonadales bacterium]